MKSQTIHYYAVVTGDIVKSSRLPRARFREVQDVIRSGGVELQKQFPLGTAFQIQLFRGDSWQLLVPDPGHALRLALYLRAYVRAESHGVDTRFAIGVGPVDNLPEGNVSDGRGEAFRISGELADDKRSSRMKFGLFRQDRSSSASDYSRVLLEDEPDRNMSFGITTDHLDGWWEEYSVSTLLTVLDVTASRWTPAQATALCGAIRGWKQEQIAQNWPDTPITQQSASQHLTRAGWDAVRASLEYYEHIMSRWSPL